MHALETIKRWQLMREAPKWASSMDEADGARYPWLDASTPVRLDGQGTDRISGSCSQTPALGVVLARWEDFFTAQLGG
jgi:hypothetical protein